MKVTRYKPSEIRTAVIGALASAEDAVRQALTAGAMLLEVKASLERGQWLPWLARECPELSEDRAERWMRAAANSALGAGVQTSELSMPWSRILAAPDGDLTAEAREARQLYFEFIADKTIKDCLAGVAVEGDEPHRITRAANGKKLGGHSGEDRKDWPKFIGEKLADISSHLNHKLTPAQRTAIGAAFDAATRAWPRWLNELLSEYVKRENKLSDEQRAARKGGE